VVSHKKPEELTVQIIRGDSLESIAETLKISPSAVYARVYRLYSSGRIRLTAERIKDYRSQLYRIRREEELVEKRDYYQRELDAILAKRKRDYKANPEKKKGESRERYRNSKNKEKIISRNTKRKKQRRQTTKEFRDIEKQRGLELNVEGVSIDRGYIVLQLRDPEDRRTVQNHFILAIEGRGLSLLYDSSCCIYSLGKLYLRLLDSPGKSEEKSRFIQDYTYFMRQKAKEKN
jgi:DNA-binding Lrp family transcriptional regulator